MRCFLQGLKYPPWAVFHIVNTRLWIIAVLYIFNGFFDVGKFDLRSNSLDVFYGVVWCFWTVYCGIFDIGIEVGILGSKEVRIVNFAVGVWMN